MIQCISADLGARLRVRYCQDVTEVVQHSKSLEVSLQTRI